MIDKPNMSRAEKAAAQRAAKAEKSPRERRTVIFEKGRGTSLHTIIKYSGRAE
jgi:hypothetical protein